jgi:hypothetical protein
VTVFSLILRKIIIISLESED